MANIISRGNMDSDPLNYFPNMLWKTWRTIGLGDPTPLNYEFAEYLAAPPLPGDESVRRILMGFRGAAKTYVTTTFCVNALKVNREELVLAVSGTGEYAEKLAEFAWQMVSKFDWLADLKPRGEQRTSALAFDVAGCPDAVKDTSFTARGIFGQLQGPRASKIVADDIETTNTSDTEGKRYQLRRRASELGGAIILPGGSIYMLGTAQTEQTIYREYHEEKGYELRIWPIVYPVPSIEPKKDELRRYGAALAPSIAEALRTNPHLAGTSTEPTRFSERDIIQRQKEYGAIEFDRQFKMFMDAGQGRGNPLKMRDLVVMELGSAPEEGIVFKLPSDLRHNPIPKNRVEGIDVDALNGDSILYYAEEAEGWIEPEKKVCIVDPSGEGEDETTWTIGAGLLGRIFLLWQGASTEGHTEGVMLEIARDCKRWGVQTIEVESNFGQGMFAELLRPACASLEYSPEIVTVMAGQVQKEKRIVENAEPVTSSHRLVVNAEVLRRDFRVDYTHVEAGKRRYYRLTYQFSRMTKTKGCVAHDDRVEGLAGLCKHFVGMLLRRLQDAAQEGKVRGVEAEGRKMIEERRKQGLPLYGLDKHQPKPLGRPTPRRR